MELKDDNVGTFYSFYIDDSEQSSPYAGTDGEVVTVDTYLTIAVPGDYSDRTLDSVQLGHEGTTMVGLVDYETLEDAIGSVGGLPAISSGDAGKVLTVNSGETGAAWATPSTPSIATAQTAGIVKPDGSTITIDANGTISSAGGSSNAITYDTYNNIVQPSDTANTIPSAASVKDNVILGSNNQITGTGATSNNLIGGNSNNVIRSTDNFVIGQSNTVQAGYDSNYTLRSSRFNIVAGQNNTSTRASASIIGGDTNTVSSSNAVVVGSGLTGTGLNQAIFGKYNSDSASPLVIGIGTSSSAKADGFKVTSAGNGVFAGTVQATDFLDSNGNSIVGGGGDSLPTINSGDAGKALVVNSGETGVEWATVGGGSAPVDPAHSNRNVLTGTGNFTSAWTTVMGTDRTDYRDYNFEENPIEVVEDVYEFTANQNIWAEAIAFDLIGSKDGNAGEYNGMLYKTANNTWTTGDGCYTLTTAYSNSVYTYTITRNLDYFEHAEAIQLDVLTHVIFDIDKLRNLMAGAEFAGDFPLPIGQTRWKDNGETERTLSIGLDEITLTDNHCMESPYNVERVEETNSISISAAEGVTYTWENHNDLSSASVGLIESGLVFNTNDGTDEQTFTWTVDSIQLKDRTTGDIYAIYVDNGQIGIEAVNSGM